MPMLLMNFESRYLRKKEFSQHVNANDFLDYCFSCLSLRAPSLQSMALPIFVTAADARTTLISSNVLKTLWILNEHECWHFVVGLEQNCSQQSLTALLRLKLYMRHEDSAAAVATVSLLSVAPCNVQTNNASVLSGANWILYFRFRLCLHLPLIKFHFSNIYLNNYIYSKQERYRYFYFTSFYYT